MGGVITALRYQKRNKDRVNVYLDGRFAFALPAMEAARLHKGQELSDEEIERLQRVDLEQKAYDRALRFLGYRPRSIAEVERYLRRHHVDESIIQQVIKRLQRVGYLDDDAFARFWVENRQQFNPRGIHALRQELRLKGVATEVIEEAIGLAAVDEEELAYRSASSRARRWRALDRPSFWRKAGSYLARRGFSYDIIQVVLRRLWEEIQATETEDPTSGHYDPTSQ